MLLFAIHDTFTFVCSMLAFALALFTVLREAVRTRRTTGVPLMTGAWQALRVWRNSLGFVFGLIFLARSMG